MCGEVADYYPSTIQFVPECYKSQEMFNKFVNTCFFPSDSVPERYKAQKLCDEFVPDWFIRSKMLERFYDSLLANDDILSFDEEFSKVTFYAKRWKIAKISGTAKNAFTLCLLVVFSLGLLEDFGTENYIWKLDIIQKSIFLMWLLGNNLFQYLQIIY